MKQTPQKLKRPENELQPSLKLCERRRKKSGTKFSFSVPLPNSASRFGSVSCYFPPADSSFRPQGQYSGNVFRGSDLCFDEERGVIVPVLAHPKTNYCRQDRNHDFGFGSKKQTHSKTNSAHGKVNSTNSRRKSLPLKEGTGNLKTGILKKKLGILKTGNL